MSSGERVLPDALGWWLVRIHGGPVKIVEIDREYAHAGGYLYVVGHEGDPVEWGGFDWIRPADTRPEPRPRVRWTRLSASDSFTWAAEIGALRLGVVWDYDNPGSPWTWSADTDGEEHDVPTEVAALSALRDHLRALGFDVDDAPVAGGSEHG